MEFIKIKDKEEAGKMLAGKIGELLLQDKRVLWLLSGGSNVSIAVSALQILRKDPNVGLFLRRHEVIFEDVLAVTLTDERYGDVGHADSNWQQLIEAGFDFTKVKCTPVLDGSDFVETVRKFGENYQAFLRWADVIVGQFGLGADGHTAGVLPDTIGVADEGTACFYDALNFKKDGQGGKFQRISLTLNTIKNIDVAYTFAFGESKKDIINSLQTQNISTSQMPAQILKQIKESHVIFL